MRTLRSPAGCPWDREQTLQSLRPFVLGETYELLDALDRDDLAGLREELGDVLYQVVFLAQLAEESAAFSIGEAIDGITQKLIRRHPHVFTPDGRPLAEAAPAMSSDEVVRKWEDLKAAERGTAAPKTKTTLSGVPRTLPALLRAYELTARAAAVGFDWAGAEDVLAKIDEELAEVREAVAGGHAREVEDELGDWLFACVNYARKLGVEPEAALRRASDKFQARFTAMEARAAAGDRRFADLTLDQQNALWDAVKRDHGGATP